MNQNQVFKAAICKLFSERLRATRKARGLNIKTLRKKAHVSMNSLYTWERGEYLPTLDALYKLKHALGCTWGDLLGD